MQRHGHDGSGYSKPYTRQSGYYGQIGLRHWSTRPPVGCYRVCCVSHRTPWEPWSTRPTRRSQRLVFEGHTMVLGQLRELVTDPNASFKQKAPSSGARTSHGWVAPETRRGGLGKTTWTVTWVAWIDDATEGSQPIELCADWAMHLKRMGDHHGQEQKQLALDSEKLIIKEKSDIPDQFHSSECRRLRRYAEGAWPWRSLTWFLGRTWEVSTTIDLSPSQRATSKFHAPDIASNFEGWSTGVFVPDPCGGGLETAARQTVCNLMRRFYSSAVLRSGVSFATPPKGPLTRQRHQASRRTTFHPMGVAKATGQIGGHTLTKAKVEVHMEKERTKAGAQCCPNFCWDVTTRTWTCMEGACVSTHLMAKCNDAPDGGECPRGWHLCSRKGVSCSSCWKRSGSEEEVTCQRPHQLFGGGWCGPEWMFA